MKKIIFSILSLFLIASLQAQITLLDDEGNEIEDEQEFEFSSIEEEDAKLHLYIRNDVSSTINIRAEMLEIEGTETPSEVQFCMGDCLFQVSEGTIVPKEGEDSGFPDGFPINEDTTTDGVGTYFWNQNDTNDAISYRFKIYQVDQFGNETGTPIHINYIYSGTMDVSSVNSVEATKIYPTITTDFTNIVLQENAEVNILNLQGKSVKTHSLKSGESTLNLSSLSSGIYLIQLQGESGATTTKKVVKR